MENVCRALRTWTLFLVVLAAGTLFHDTPLAQSRTPWDAVYSTAQAERGSMLYAATCLRCHGPNLEGANDASASVVGGVALSGDTFKKNWYGGTVNDLYDKISKTMPVSPATMTGTLTQVQVLELIAFILSRNGFPSGAAELQYTPDLAVVDILGKEGPVAPESGQPARAIGCLAAGDTPNTWLLSNATLPIKTKSVSASTGPVLARANATAIGSHRIRLLNARPGTTTPVGAKVEAKGRYVKVGNEDRISVLSFQMLSPTCG